MAQSSAARTPWLPAAALEAARRREASSTAVCGFASADRQRSASENSTANSPQVIEAALANSSNSPASPGPSRARQTFALATPHELHRCPHSRKLPSEEATWHQSDAPRCDRAGPP
eukprot:CAMPEP_0175249148 /NCGR_PEP_ID=MMETSP0093-20121207/34499_1 /TAXON_ID=311494 /ORGANISM="Alexandrium monilatum, Strain CCMP3105" /LENGTH=115 /DNA_ID=CAMNT_0016543375 /DNA_START=103 /DNA_END=447 /DNA_ORIENTATION=+